MHLLDAAWVHQLRAVTESLDNENREISTSELLKARIVIGNQALVKA